MEVVFHYDAGPALRDRLGTLRDDGLLVRICAESDDDRFFALMRQCEVLWHVLRPVSTDVVEAAPRLRFIQKIGVGVNTIDLEAARARGIPVCNMPGTNSRAVAEHTLALMLAALRRVSAFDRTTRAGDGWAWPPETQDRLGELAGRTVGLVGYGAIPRLLAPILAAMQAHVLYTSRQPKPDAAAEWSDLKGLLARADIVSLHIPETPETAGLLDRSAIAGMKRGAVLVNTARGGIVDEAALCEALGTGHLAAAGLDVFADEPVRRDNPLLALDNVVVTPHIAWITKETMERSLTVAVENCRRLDSGETLLHRVA